MLSAYHIEEIANAKKEVVVFVVVEDEDVVVVLSAGIEPSKNDSALEILALGKRRISHVIRSSSVRISIQLIKGYKSYQETLFAKMLCLNYSI